MLLSGKAKCFDCILVYYFEIKVSPFEEFHGPYGKTGLQSMIILQVDMRYLGRCNLGDPQESTLFRGASSTTKQENILVINQYTPHRFFACQS